ncbi:MAG: Rrf2 family transcriptional regulator [Deltaproteobacteria bacterium]|nr:Rrf2 family transcriptional regulator [Deltaproteobacteria bacterium]MBW2306614.1 Rrf2 family transcriptional regulator [Deltaproteobacteria bacterium]
MRISTRGRYAIRLLLDLARNSKEGKPVRLADVAKRTCISRGYLEQLAIALKNNSLIKGIPGKKGGYCLAKPPECIRLHAVIQAAIGPISITDCATDPEICLMSHYCECRPIWTIINKRIVEVLNEYSLSDLMDASRLSGISARLTELDT